MTWKRILLVEERAETAALWEKYFSMAGFHSVIRCCVAGAAEAIASNPPFDVVLCNDTLPDGSGLDVLAILRGLQAQTPFILAIGSSDQEVIAQVRGAGRSMVINKPFAFMELLNAVKALCTKPSTGV